MLFPRLTRPAAKLFKIAQDILFPRRCVACRTAGNYFCPACQTSLPLSPRYGTENSVTAVSYGHPAVRQLVWLLKYRGIREIAGLFAPWVYEIIIEELAELALFREQAGKVLVIPVPLSPQRFRQRGFNQAEEIGRRLSELDPKLFKLEAENLVKIKETKTQVSARNRQARLENLAGAFLVKNRRTLRGKTIILLDDVTTTGTTFREAERALNRARPRKIIKIAVAGN